MNRGIHTKPNDGLSVDWITPQWLIEALWHFHLDPCAHPDQPWKTAARMIAPPEDGLACEWRGRAWLNPPYGAALKKWLEKLAEHGDGIALVPSRTEVESWFWPLIWERANAVFFFRGRLYFARPDGTTSGNAGHGSVLAIYGMENVISVMQAIHRRKLKGRLVNLNQ